MISCICVTRGDRLSMLADAIGDFARQTFADRELVVLHDGDKQCHEAIETLAQAYLGQTIRVKCASKGPNLGALRNLAIASARGDWICQWDDDDRYHPLRLQLQWDSASAKGAPVNYLTDQLHWFRADHLLFWDDWDREPYPMNVVQGTILARRDILPLYPDLPAGEDTLHTHALLRASVEQGFGIARLKGAGWCYIYSYHGQNVWNAAHHRAISTLKHLPPEKLLSRLPKLRARLAEYSPPVPGLSVPVGKELVSLS